METEKIKKIGTTPGELYFMDEKDFFTRDASDNVKIGLVRGLPKEGNTIQKRLSQHQTGNSRELDLRHSMITDSISVLESTVHQHLATARLHGEWFVLPGENFQKSVDIANRIESSLKSMAKAVQESLELSNVESDGSILKPTDSDIALHTEILALRAEKREVKKIISGHEFDIASEVQDCFGIAGIAHWKASATPEAKFSKTKFQKNDPEFANRLAKLSELASGQFNIVGAGRASSVKIPKPENVNQLIKNKTYLDRTQDYERLHYQILVKLVELSKLELELAGKEAELKTRIGISDGIEGIANWKRDRKAKLPDDTEEIVRAKDTGLWMECFETRAKSVSLEIFDYRPYLSESYQFKTI
jgi:hypothetical protein